MNRYDLSYLAAKDVLVLVHGEVITFWTLEHWNEQVDDLAAGLRNNHDGEWESAYD